MKTYTDEERRKLVEGLAKRKGTVAEYCREVGVSDVALFDWRKKFMLAPMKEKKAQVEVTKSNGIVGLEFNIVQEKDAREWAYSARSGRFMELKENLLTQLRNLRKGQSLTFQAPSDKKEVAAVQHACYSVIKKNNLTYTINYSKSKDLIVIIRRGGATNGDKP